MFQGHLDEVSHQLVQGWAADDTRLDDSVDVSIFVDGRRIARVACDRLRQDLQQTGQYGNGRHGFAYRFGTPLSGSKTIHLSVRFSQTGATLSRGDCILEGKTVRVLQPATPLAPDEPIFMPAPRNPRALFELLCWYDQRFWLAPLLSRLDLDGYKSRQLHYAVFGKLPEPGAMQRNDEQYYPRDHLNDLLLSDAFQDDVLRLLLDAYQDKQRLIFLHIPKCAGTDLSNKLKTRYPWVDFNIMDKDWTPKDALLRHLARLAVQLRFGESIFLCGHAEPAYYTRRGLVRPTDQIFTVVRHPYEVMMSQINYVLTRFSIDTERGEIGPDTQEWLQQIGIETLPEQLTEEFVQDAGMRMLRNTGIVRPNSLCYWLGGTASTAQAALDALIAQDAEVTDTNHYTDWLSQRWNIQSQSRDNSSMKFFHVEMLSEEDRYYMHDIAIEDIKLYEIAERSIAYAGTPSVTGQELMRGLE